MSVQFQQHPQQVININVEPHDDDTQRLSSPGRVPLDRMTSRLNNPYSGVQDQLMQVENTKTNSREERAARAQARRIFEKVRHSCGSVE
jgi:hypothetical protein